MMKLVEEFQDIAQSKGSSLSFSLQTNGFLLDECKLDAIRAHDIALGLSIDGSPEIHDRERKSEFRTGTFTALPLKHLSKEDRSKMPITLVVTPRNVSHLVGSIQFLWDRGFRLIVFKINLIHNWREKERNIAEGAFEELASWYRYALHRSDAPVLRPLVARMAAIYHHWPWQACGAGEDMWALAPDGVAHPCSLHWALNINPDGRNQTKRAEMCIKSECIVTICGINCLAFAEGKQDKRSLICWHERLLYRISRSLLEEAMKVPSGPIVTALQNASRDSLHCYWV